MQEQSDNDPLVDIDAALALGDLLQARQVADRLLRQTQDTPSQVVSTALLKLAWCDLAESRIRQAHAKAVQVAQAAREAGWLALEVDALSLQARTASVMGRAAEAVESGLLATRLANADLPALLRARTHCHLGLAYGWARAFDAAEAAFGEAAALLQSPDTEGGQLELAVAQAWAHAIRHADERRADPAVQARWQALQAWPSVTPGAPMLTPGAAATLAPSRRLVQALLALACGDHGPAERLLAAAEGDTGTGAGWVQAARSWLAAERAAAAKQWDVAAMHASRMAGLAKEIQHLPLQSLGHQLAASVYRHNAQPDAALQEQQLQLQCERAMRANDLAGRPEAAAQRLEARLGQVRLEALARQSTAFEQWAHEDALTGIANLRRFNQCLQDWSRAAEQDGSTLCVAMIDADDFRDINNRFSYDVGNQALQGIAAAMAAQVRAEDLPARWGGDEFAILFRDTDLHTAEQIALRVQQAVEQRDWAAVAPGLSVGVSVGVSEVRPGDTRASIIARSAVLMRGQKQGRKRARVEQAVAPMVLDTVAAWLRQAERVLMVVGHDTPEHDLAEDGDDGAVRRHFHDVRGLQADPAGFARWWDEWRRQTRRRRPSAAHAALVELTHRLPQATFVTERVDGVLAMAGALNVMELYGNAFRQRCARCGKVDLHADGGACWRCNDAAPTWRPDIVLLGELPDARLQAGAELAAKRADVILVLDCDGSVSTTRSLVTKGWSRHAHVVVLGRQAQDWRGAAHACIAAPPQDVIENLALKLDDAGPAAATRPLLSEAGFEFYAFLTGLRADDRGHTLDAVLAWKDWELATQLRCLPWLFPLLTESMVNPAAPMPSRQDFQRLAADEQACAAMRRGFERVLRYYGFEWQAGAVVHSEDWRMGFATWATAPSHHDRFISRILGALALMGLREEAMAMLKAVEEAALHYRGEEAHGPLWHWRQAVHGVPTAPRRRQGTAAASPT